MDVMWVSVRFQMQIGIRMPVQRVVGVRGSVHISAFIYIFPSLFKKNICK